MTGSIHNSLIASGQNSPVDLANTQIGSILAGLQETEQTPHSRSGSVTSIRSFSSTSHLASEHLQPLEVSAEVGDVKSQELPLSHPV